MFFFSSRRRHTRFDCDWSSDVCSSDLSMDGFIASLREICDLAARYDALVMVDDSHATGFMGPTGRGTPEHCAVGGRDDILTGTLGKGLAGGARGHHRSRARATTVRRGGAWPPPLPANGHP